MPATDKVTPRRDAWRTLVRHFPWTADPWENDEWELVRDTRRMISWEHSENGMEVHAFQGVEEGEDGWHVRAVPDQEAPTGGTFHPHLTPDAADKQTAVYLAEQYMKNGLGLIHDSWYETLYPPRADV